MFVSQQKKYTVWFWFAKVIALNKTAFVHIVTRGYIGVHWSSIVRLLCELFRPNTGVSSFDEEKSDLLQKYRKISADEAGVLTI